MRIFALQTNVDDIRRKFLTEGEKEVLFTTKHALAFVWAFLLWTPLTLLVFAVLTFIEAQQLLDTVILNALAIAIGVFYLFFLLNAYIAWRYNFLFVTTQKVVLIENQSFFYSNITPLHLEHIARTTIESQFFGIFNCGILHIYLRAPISETKGNPNKFITSYIPHYDDVAAVIENGIVILKSNGLEKGKEEHKQEIMRSVGGEQVEATSTATVEEQINKPEESS